MINHYFGIIESNINKAIHSVDIMLVVAEWQISATHLSLSYMMLSFMLPQSQQ